MKKFNLLLFLVFTLFLAYHTTAQSFVVKGGFNLNKIYVADEDDTYSDEYDMKPGFHFGAAVEIPINSNLMFEPGIMFITKGVKMDDPDYEVSSKVNLNYLDLPLLLKASTSNNEGLGFYGALGPYIGIGLNGKATSEYDGEEESNDIEFGSDEDEDDLKRLDIGISIGGGIEFSSFQFGVSYDYGLMNIATYQDYGNTIKNRVLKFTLGYKFGN
jgi:hypothetical protein